MKTETAKTSGRTAVLALFVPFVLFLFNFAVHNVQTVADSRIAYYLIVILGPGILLPLFVLGWLKNRHGIDPRFGNGRWEPFKLAGALAAGLVIASFPLGRQLAAEPAHALHVFVWAFMTSIVEVLVFLGIVYNVIHALVSRVGPRWLAVIIGVLAASALFALYHFSYSPPWNTSALALTVGVVWLEVATVYLITRSLWAAIVFNNTMAMLGFLLNRVTALDGEPLALGLLLDALLVALTVLLSRERGRKVFGSILVKGWAAH